MPSPSMDLAVGASYSSYKSLLAAVEKFSIETNSVYTVYNSKSIEAENKNRPAEKRLPSCLRYKTIKFACKHYGKLRSRSRGLRPNQSTFKIGCPSFIYASAHNTELVVEKIEPHHSHSCDPELVALYPERRSLSHLGKEVEEEDESGAPSLKLVREDVLDLLSMGVERRRIRNYVRICTGRIMLTGDLANLAKYVREHPRIITEERSVQLLDHVKMIESKENIPAPKQLSAREKFSALKRKVNFPVREIKTEIVRDDDPPEHCYSLVQAGPPSKKRLVIGGQLHDESMEEISQQFSEPCTILQEGENVVTAWDENSSLADVVKSILGPNQEGPIIVHVNNYDGVSVVEVADPSKYNAVGEEISPSNDESDMQPPIEAVSSEVLEPTVTLKTMKSNSPIKIVVPAEGPSTRSRHVPAVKRSPVKRAVSCNVESDKEDQNVDMQQEDFHDEAYDQEDFSEEDEFDGESVIGQSSVLREERNMYSVKTEKLKLQIQHIKSDLEKQELEKEKLRLEIRLLKLQVQEKESEISQPHPVRVSKRS